MNAPISIMRGVISTILAIAYLLMSVASVTHELSHLAMEKSSASAGLSHALDIHGSDAHGLPGVESKSSPCFFCAYNPMVLMLVVLALVLGVRLTVRLRSLPLPQRRIITPLLSSVGLRAPPALG